MAQTKLVLLPTMVDDALFINCREFTDIYTKEREQPYRTRSDINALHDPTELTEDYLNERDIHADDIDFVLKALGLNPIPLLAPLVTGNAEPYRRAPSHNQHKKN